MMRRETILRALDGGARGVLGAMAMTGMRRVTTGLGLVEKTPPRALAEQAPLLRRLLRRVPAHRRADLVELGHWANGGVCGVAYAALPARHRAWKWSGIVYGLGIWALFETGVVPLLGLEHTRERTVVSRAFLAADHVLYGAVVGSAPWRPRS